ncbi:BamA/TamA family outer membrane protein [Flammeovirga aprica]|uniref:BamA/TamA family outer membrane protein n=1 Tax=Flammeovirga aprica JL-4 TaxID=694437 RepID=A0A7X9RVG5_9BACT|nr:BamA/TamA family outer membrane protein [Flammeovirga aprica]NME69468.1 BamA/TamA family outer membrane protein [Flammeovirga aprica JL-4]
MNRHSILGLFLIVTFSFATYGQEKKDKNLKFSALGGPGYSPDYGLLIGGTMLFTFKTNPLNQDLRKSVVPLHFTILEEGYNVQIHPQLFLKGGDIRVFSDIEYLNNYNHYYGFGFEENRYIPRGKETTQYFQNTFIFRNDVLFRINDSHFFIGPSLDYTDRRLTDVAEGIKDDWIYNIQGGTDEGINFRNVGFGLRLTYDTRDIPVNAYSGVYFNVSSRFYNKSLGSTTNWGVFTAEYRQYKKLPKLGERKVLAWTANVRSTIGNVPFTDMSLIGSPYDLRGYYKGQFRHRTAAYMLAEFRSMWNSPSKFVNKLGYTVWGGVGMIGPDLLTPEGILPNFGVGLRYEVQPRMNFRIDIGHDPLQKQTLIYFNMTEAF